MHLILRVDEDSLLWLYFYSYIWFPVFRHLWLEVVLLLGWTVHCYTWVPLHVVLAVLPLRAIALMTCWRYCLINLRSYPSCSVQVLPADRGCRDSLVFVSLCAVCAQLRLVRPSFSFHLTRMCLVVKWSGLTWENIGEMCRDGGQHWHGGCGGVMILLWKVFIH